MKIRTGFVSNSSSSSFICEICNRTEIGWDGNSLSDFDMVRCVNEHTFCTSHMINIDTAGSSREIPDRSSRAMTAPSVSFMKT